MDKNELIKIASQARNNAYVPYSNFEVGAVLLCKNGKIYTGCNVENHGIQSICAERVAFCKAISEGEKDFISITVVGGNKDDNINEECLPCGYCRQLMSEFVNKNFEINTINNTYKITDLLPYSFKL